MENSIVNRLEHMSRVSLSRYPLHFSVDHRACSWLNTLSLSRARNSVLFRRDSSRHSAVPLKLTFFLLFVVKFLLFFFSLYSVRRSPDTIDRKRQSFSFCFTGHLTSGSFFGIAIVVCFCHFLSDIFRVFFVYFCVFLFRLASSLTAFSILFSTSSVLICSLLL